MAIRISKENLNQMLIDSRKAIVDEVYRRLNIRVELKINNRKILTGIAEVIGEAERITDITVAIDKLDKIGIENVNLELSE